MNFPRTGTSGTMIPVRRGWADGPPDVGFAVVLIVP
jgi:hypothetical protein